MTPVKRRYKLRLHSQFRGEYIDVLVVPTLIWEWPKRGHPDEFIVVLAIANDSLQQLGYSGLVNGGSWTEVAHSDHNPDTGHDIYDHSDPKQLHIDVNHPHDQSRYSQVYRKLANGAPPRPTGRAADMAKEILVRNQIRFLRDYLP